MPFFRNLFGKKPEHKVTTGETIQNLRTTEELLLKKQEFLENKIRFEIDLAKKHGLTNKRLALQALKRKKRFEKQLQQIDGNLTTIELQRETLESANTNITVLKTMTEAAKTLKTAHQSLDVDKVHDMMDDIAEQQEVSREITEAISNPVAFGLDIDDEDLERELAGLEQEGLEEALLTVEPSKTKIVAPAPLPGQRRTNAAFPYLGPGKPRPEVTGQTEVTAEGKPRLPDEDENEMKELAAWAA